MPSVVVLHPHIDRMTVVYCQGNRSPSVYHAGVHSLVYPYANPIHRVCRKSRIVGAVEEIHKSVDTHCIDRLGVIQSAKERHAFNQKQKAGRAIRLYAYCNPLVLCIYKHMQHHSCIMMCICRYLL